ncbi:hypothetical protein Q2T76_06655 [Lactobacillus sp. YT155]|uniref:hypothetical protein n=1 Tax=Lactobacillus sp. YT155 TaxID=3060955 RepID=UPI00265E5C53|nr:hypothetical protein [Lactobacillus sp. YT155]MDO1605736.1 hypothetical protein [Lactobacillus sp. YT155]
MFKSKSSILSVHYADSIEVPLGDEVKKYIDPENFTAEIESGKHKFEIEKIKISLPDVDGEDELDDVFKEEKIYNQMIYLVIPEVSKFPSAKTAINGRPIHSAERILADLDILVLRRELIVTNEVTVSDEDYEKVDLNKELEKNTNSIWSNHEIEPQQFVTAIDKGHIPLFDDFGNLREDDQLLPGEEINVHMKRVNSLENIEYYKVFEKRYVRVSDVTEATNEVQAPDDIDEQVQDIMEEDNINNFDEAVDTQIDYEEVEPFEVEFNNQLSQLFYDENGQPLADEFPENGATYTVVGILHTVVDFCKIGDNKYILGQDTVQFQTVAQAEAEMFAQRTTEPTEQLSGLVQPVADQSASDSEEIPETAVEEVASEVEEIPEVATEFHEDNVEELESSPINIDEEITTEPVNENKDVSDSEDVKDEQESAELEEVQVEEPVDSEEEVVEETQLEDENVAEEDASDETTLQVADEDLEEEIEKTDIVIEEPEVESTSTVDLSKKIFQEMPEETDERPKFEQAESLEIEEIIDDENSDELNSEDEIIEEIEVDEPVQDEAEEVIQDSENEELDADYDKEMAKTDAHAVYNAFDIEFDEKSEAVDGIVQVNGDETDTVRLFSSYQTQERRLLKDNIKGQTFWYTTEVGYDDKGDKYYKIAENTWVSANDVKYFDK